MDNSTGLEGRITGVSVGTTNITAGIGGVDSTISLQVTNAVLESIQVIADQTSIARGTMTLVQAIGIYSNGSSQNISDQVAWSSSNSSILQIANLTSVPKREVQSPGSGSLGSARISATLEAITSDTNIVVTAATLVSIEISPTNPSVSAGLEKRFTATGIYTDGSTQDISTQVTWSSSDTSKATISNSSGSEGVALANSAGATNISATLGGVVASPTTLTVTNAVLNSINITPSLPSVAGGRSVNLTATGTYSDGSISNLTVNVAWTSDDSSIASVDNITGREGQATGIVQGNTQIHATLGGVSATIPFTVTAAVLDSIEVTLESSSIAKGTSTRAEARGIFSDGSNLNLSDQVVWSSSQTSVIQLGVLDSGSNQMILLNSPSSGGTGISRITASLNSVSGFADLTVTSPTLVSIQVDPTNPSVANGLTQNFTATGRYTDGSTQDLNTQVTWSSSDTSKATISNASGTEGRATGVASGIVTVSAALGSISGNTSLEVVFLDTTAPTITNVVALTPSTVRVTYSESVNETQAKTASIYKLALSASVTGSGSVYTLTLGSSQTSNANYTMLIDKSGVQDLSTSPNNLGCGNYGDFLGQEQIKVISAVCANPTSVILNLSKAPKTGNNVTVSAECTGSTECGNRYKLVGASDLGTINSAKILDGIVCNGASADTAKICVVHNLVQTGAQYSIIAADSVDGDGFDNTSWGSIRNSLDTENLQSSPRDRASFLGCGTSPVNFADGPISIDPNASTFGYLADFNSKIYSGPNNTGNGAQRFAYDGSIPEATQFTFEKDNTAQDGDATNVSSNTAASRENGILVPPYVTIGHSGCTSNNGTLALGCGPDN